MGHNFGKERRWLGTEITVGIVGSCRECENGPQKGSHGCQWSTWWCIEGYYWYYCLCFIESSKYWPVGFSFSIAYENRRHKGKNRWVNGGERCYILSNIPIDPIDFGFCVWKRKQCQSNFLLLFLNEFIYGSEWIYILRSFVQSFIFFLLLLLLFPFSAVLVKSRWMLYIYIVATINGLFLQIS